MALSLSCSKLIRGHCVFWAVDTEVPDWVKNIPNNYELKAKLKERLKNLLGRYRGRLVYNYQLLLLFLLLIMMISAGSRATPPLF